MAITKQEIIDAVGQMTVIELSELVKEMEEKFGVSAAAAVVAAGAGASGTQEAAEEKTSFDVVLSEIGTNKIAVIKVVRAITSLGLTEAKQLVDSAPKAIKQGVAKSEADDIVKQFAEVGAKIELK